MNVLVGCEKTGRVRESFRLRGHNAWSCDLQETDIPGKHIKGDLLDAINNYHWDLLIAFPPCTYLTVAGNRWFLPKWKDKYPTREQDRLDAIIFFMQIIASPIEKIAVENPVGVMSIEYRKPDQVIHPYMFGEPFKKKTCLWLHNLPLLVPANPVEPEFIYNSNATRSGMMKDGTRKTYEMPVYNQDKSSNSRSKTFWGVADQMAAQWG